MNTSTHLWLRAENKANEHRVALAPADARQLIEQGLRISVEECPERCIPLQEYVDAGCEAVPRFSWKSAPADAWILGLKELPVTGEPLHHKHIHFAHAFKDQQGWQEVLQQFKKGGGSLYDLEYLVDDAQRRVAAFGFWAGFAGAAVGVMNWAKLQATGQGLDRIDPFSSQEQLISHIREQLGTRRPRVLVIGAKGRCGQGAVLACEKLGVEVTGWDIEETRAGGPFHDILNFDVLINCVFIAKKIPPFITMNELKQERQLQVITDVSCDPYGDYNPLPIYEACTTFVDPVLELDAGAKPLQLIAIDHLPSLLPRESSEDYSGQLLSALREIPQHSAVWQRALDLYQEKIKSL